MKNTMDNKIILTLQIIAKNFSIPDKNKFSDWINVTLNQINYKNSGEICIRVIDASEMTHLNKIYRNKNYPTNVLSFNYSEKQRVIGDIVICAPIVEKEAKQQNIASEAHYAHLTIHGLLHLLGFNHDHETEAEKMEQLEAEILKKLGYDIAL